MPITYRNATHKDDFTTFSIAIKSLKDYGLRTGVMAITGGNDLEKSNSLWEQRRSFWAHLSNSCDQYWLAEKDEGEAIGYARSILRGDHRELTEFFVLPNNQSTGVGKELIQRAFPHDTRHRSIIGTSDFRAMSRYLKEGVYPFVTELYFESVPKLISVETDLLIESPNNTVSAIQRMSEIDLVILGYRRDIDHRFLMQDRRLYFYKRKGNVVGYGYISKDYYGPFALLDNTDFPAIIAHAERQAYTLGAKSVGFETPTINTISIDFLMKRGYRLEGFTGSIMSNKPFGKFENYLLSSPPYFL